MVSHHAPHLRHPDYAHTRRDWGRLRMDEILKDPAAGKDDHTHDTLRAA